MFEDLFEKARQTMTTDKAAEDCGLTKDTKIRLSQIKDLGCVKDAKMQIGAISHRKDGDYRKVAEGKFVPVKMPGKGGANKSAAQSQAEKINSGVESTMEKMNQAKKIQAGVEAAAKKRGDSRFSGESNSAAPEFSKEDKIEMLSNYMHKMYKNVPVEKWKESYNSKMSDKELDEAFKDYAESHGNAVKAYKKGGESKPAAKKETKAAKPASNKSVNMGLNKQAALAFAKKSGDTAFLMKNKDGEYAVANSAAEFDAAEKAGYEAANEELHPHNQVSAVRRDSATPKGVMSELSRGFYNSKHPEDFERDMADMGYETLEFNDEYAVVQNNKGSQFQVKFSDHGDGRDFGAESINLTYQDEDDDTDYDELD